MTSDVSTPPDAADPVTAAINDPAVQTRLFNAAMAFVHRRASGTLRVQRVAEAEEIVQTAKIRAWERRHGFDPDRADVVSWLVGFVSTVARERCGKPPRTGTGPPVHAIEPDEHTADTCRPVPEEVTDRLFAAELLGRLPADERELLNLRFEDGLTCAEIGARIGAKENAVRVRVFRVIDKLRQSCGLTGEVGHG